MKTLITLSFLITLPAFAGGGSSVGTGNPAAGFCIKLGGQLERTVSREGEDANCAIGEWDLFRAMDKEKLVRPIKCNPHIPCMPNPASVNCDDAGGKLRIVSTPAGENGVCVIEEWTLFRLFHK